MKIKENVGIGDLGIILNQVKQNKDDISDIKNKISTERCEIVSSYSCIYVFKTGNVVSIDIDGTIQESSGKIASNLPKAVYNYTYIKELGNQSYLRIDCNGNLYINSHTAGNWANIHGTYISTD